VTVTKMISDIYYLPQYSLLIFTVHAYVLLNKLQLGSPHDVVYICLVTVYIDYHDEMLSHGAVSLNTNCHCTNCKTAFQLLSYLYFIKP